MQTIVNFDCQQIYKFLLYDFFFRKNQQYGENSNHSLFLESHRRYASVAIYVYIYEYLSLICRLDADRTARQNANKCTFRGVTCFVYIKNGGHVSPSFSGDRIRSLAFADRSRASLSVKRFFYGTPYALVIFKRFSLPIVTGGNRSPRHVHVE